MSSKCLKLEPTIVRKIWGGKRLQTLKNITESNDLGIGETWEVSSHKDGPSLLNGKLINAADSREHPYLVKLIDTSDNLSVQVHPDDAFAKEHENSLGKTECWFIVDAKEGSGIYLGLKDGISKEIFLEELNRGGELNHLLKFFPVCAGDFFYVPAGTIHAIGSDVFLAEVQQSSGITYRVWDWNRVDEKGIGRELHVDKAMQVINFDSEKNLTSYFKAEKGLMNRQGVSEVVSHPQFRVKIINLKKGESITLELAGTERIESLLMLNGKALVDDDGELDSYQSYLISSDNKTLKMTCHENLSCLYIY